MVWPRNDYVGKTYTVNTLPSLALQLPSENERYFNAHNKELLPLLHPNHVRFTAQWIMISKETASVRQLMKFLANGMNIVRLSYSLGPVSFLLETLNNIRQAREEYSKQVGRYVPLAISTDDVGSIIQVGHFLNEKEYFPKGYQVMCTDDIAFFRKSTRDILYIGLENIHLVLSPGNKINIDFDRVVLTVDKIIGTNISCTVEIPGFLTSRVKVFIFGTHISLTKFTLGDFKALSFAIKNNLDIFCPSSVETLEDVLYIRKKIKSLGGKIALVPKIDNLEGTRNIDSILPAVEGVFLGRGYVGYSVGIHKVPLIQKLMIAKSNIIGKPICVLGLFLTEMVTEIKPTCAETVDISNLAMDGGSSVMTHSETTIGNYPNEACNVLDKCLQIGEHGFFYKRQFRDLLRTVESPTYATDAIAISAVLASYVSIASAIICLTQSGKTAQLLSKYFPRCPILAVSRKIDTVNMLQLYRAVIPLYYNKPRHENWCCDMEQRLEFGIQFAAETGITRNGDPIILLHPGKPGSTITSTLRIIMSPNMRPFVIPEVNY